jgi:hypothetical protein
MEKTLKHIIYMLTLLGGLAMLGGCNHISHQLCGGTVAETVASSKQAPNADIVTTGTVQTEAAGTVQPFRLATRFFN